MGTTTRRIAPGPRESMLFKQRRERGVLYDLESLRYGVRRAVRKNGRALAAAVVWLVCVSAAAFRAHPELFHAAAAADAARGGGGGAAGSDGYGSAAAARADAAEAFRHAWEGYERHAFGHDEVRPVSNATNDSWGGYGAVMVDGIDTMMLMGMGEAERKARAHVGALRFKKDYEASFFETMIRYVGGLLGAHSVGGGGAVYLDKARELADLLLPSFESSPRTGLPRSKVNLLTGRARNHDWNGGHSILAEVGSSQLELAYLSHHTGDPRYARAARRVTDFYEGAAATAAAQGLLPGLFPVYVDPDSGGFDGRETRYTMGSLADSFYEYLLKVYVLTSRTDDPDLRALRMYNRAVDGMREHLVVRTSGGRAFLGEHNGRAQVPRQEHLACFVPGMLALGAMQGRALAALAPFLDADDPRRVLSERGERDLALAEELAASCFATYAAQPTGLGPESVRVDAEADTFAADDPKYILRPETAESMFVLWRATHRPVYREWGGRILAALRRHCRTPAAFSGLVDVRAPGGRAEWNDSMQSFVMSETFKYLYLLFGEDTELPLDEYVFTTEAHPLRVLPPSSAAGGGGGQ